MDVETAIRAFASAGHDLPREAMRWALDHWDEAAPGLLGVLERFADGADRSEEAASAAFFILHLAGERRETRAFAPLCRLAKDAEAIEAVLGDGVTTTLKRILISTYDGDLDALKGVIEADGADEYVARRRPGGPGLPGGDRPGRPGGGGSLPAPALRRAAAAARELRLVRLGLAVALLGLEAMSDVVRQAFGRGLIDPMVMGYDHFREDLGRTLADPERMAGFRYDNIAPLEDAVGELSGWYAFSDAAKRDRARQVAREVSGLRAAPAAAAGRQPVQARRPQRPLPVRQREEVQEVLPAPGVGPVGRRLAVSASTLTRRDPATTVTMGLTFGDERQGFFDATWRPRRACCRPPGPPRPALPGAA